MNEETELWAAYKEQQKLERAERRALAEQQLKDRGINYTVHNGGAHIVIEEGGAIFDYWPGNTRWRMRPQKSDFGVGKLFQAIAQRRVVARELSAMEASAVVHEKIPQRYNPNGPFGNIAGIFKYQAPVSESVVKPADETDEAFVERMTRAFPHLGEEV